MCGALVLALGLVSTPHAKTSASSSNSTTTIKLAVHRITETQYRHTIADVFGSDIKINARFEPDKREDGLLAIGSAQLSLMETQLAIQLQKCLARAPIR